MSQTLEKRVEDLEKKVAELGAEVLQLRPLKKDWRQTFGGTPEDELTREANRLGSEYRKQQTYEKEIAGS
jgi:MoaA/NifB/PqqE/SkfB family radical SAM enzyme